MTDSEHVREADDGVAEKALKASFTDYSRHEIARLRKELHNAHCGRATVSRGESGLHLSSMWDGMEGCGRHPCGACSARRLLMVEESGVKMEGHHEADPLHTGVDCGFVRTSYRDHN